MLLNLKNVFDTVGETLPFINAVDLSEMDFWGTKPFPSPVRVRGTAVNRAGVVTVSYEAQFLFCAPCDRCARETSEQKKLTMSHIVVMALEGEDDAEFIKADGGTLDLDELVRSDIVLDMPARTLCGDDCKGLCPRCGRNLNDAGCGCGQNDV